MINEDKVQRVKLADVGVHRLVSLALLVCTCSGKKSPRGTYAPRKEGAYGSMGILFRVRGGGLVAYISDQVASFVAFSNRLLRSLLLWCVPA
jgi:hypothetical protein